MPPFQLQFLDHVAIRVKDLEKAAQWYEGTLGLKRIQFAEWGPAPILLLADQTGLALFPADSKKSIQKIDHFAFRMEFNQFEIARDFFRKQEIPFEEQDHHFFKSIYLTDPDGHTVELTTPIKEAY